MTIVPMVVQQTLLQSIETVCENNTEKVFAKSKNTNQITVSES